MKALFTGAAALCVLAIPASAQTQAVVAPVPSQTVAIIQPPSMATILRAGTEVPLVTREDLTTKKKQLRVGQRVQLEVASNVEMGGVIVIPTGTPAIAELTEVRNKGMWGKSGYIAARILSLRMGDRQVRLSGSFDDKGITGTGGVVAAVALLPLAGFITTGTSAHIPTGSAVKGFLDEDIAFQTVQAPAQVLTISVPATASPAAPATAPTTVPAVK